MYIGIDLGGTNIAAGVVDKAGHIVYKSSVPTLAQNVKRGFTMNEERKISEVIADFVKFLNNA